MGDAIQELTKPKTHETQNTLQSVWTEGNLADFQRESSSLTGSGLLSNLTLTNSDNAAKPQTLPINELIDLQAQLERTQRMLHGLTSSYDSGLSNFESTHRTLTGNPYKLLIAGTGLGLLYKTPWGAAPVAGLAALQGWDDIKMMGRQDTIAGRAKYLMGVLADGSTLAGAVGYLTDAIPQRFRLPLLVGGLAARAAIDFIPDRKK